jgi:hypothetical protein
LIRVARALCHEFIVPYPVTSRHIPPNSN